MSVGRSRLGREATLDLKELARSVRIASLVSVYHAGSGHPGGALSAADLLAHVWGSALKSGEGADRDRFVLSKGHSCPALYAVVAETGLIPRELLLTLRQLGSPLQGHPHVGCFPWAETSTGSLGQGFSAAIGIALGLRYQSGRGRAFVMLGDGELQEGEVWEGAMFAAHYGLDNLCAVVDYNKMQSDDLNANIMGLEPLAAKWEAFGWHVSEIDGHDFEQIDAAFGLAEEAKGKPSIVIAHTIKGKGVSFMEGSPLWHGSLKLSDQQLTDALTDLGVALEDVPACIDGSVWRGGNTDD